MHRARPSPPLHHCPPSSTAHHRPQQPLQHCSGLPGGNRNLPASPQHLSMPVPSPSPLLSSCVCCSLPSPYSWPSFALSCSMLSPPVAAEEESWEKRKGRRKGERVGKVSGRRTNGPQEMEYKQRAALHCHLGGSSSSSFGLPSRAGHVSTVQEVRRAIDGWLEQQAEACKEFNAWTSRERRRLQVGETFHPVPSAPLIVESPR